MFSRRSCNGFLLLAAAALWATGAAIAQQPGGSSGGTQQPSPSQQQQMPGQAGSAGTPTTGVPSNGPSQSFGDQMFVRDTFQNDDAQVQMSQLAQQKSSSPDVQQFGQKMAQIHTQLNEQLKPAAKQLGVSEPKGPSKKEKQQIEKLQALSGPDFDTAYIQAMAKEQEHGLKEFKNEEQSAQNSNIQQAAKQDEPILSQHYQILQKLAQAHNVTLESKK